MLVPLMEAADRPAALAQQLKGCVAAAEFRLDPKSKTRLDELSNECRTGDAAR
jgi:hypothetical protein